MMPVERLVGDYGYWIILIGTYFDHYGIPLFLVFGGIAASQKVLNVNIVLFCGFIGGWTADLFLYFLGYKTGLQYWSQFYLARKLFRTITFVDRVFQRRPAVMIIFGRFLFVVSKIIPPFAGMVRYNIRNYILCSFSGNLIFSIIYTLVSYFAGSWILNSQTGLKVGNIIFALTFMVLMVLFTQKASQSSTRN